MDTTPASVPVRADRNALHIALLVVAVLWFATGAASRIRGLQSDDDWEGPYALFSALLLVAAGTATCAITVYTSTPSPRSGRRIAAIALSIVAAASTLVAWAFPVWSVLLAAGFAALAGTGPSQRRHARWVSVSLLAGLAVALVGVSAKLGPPGSHNDYSEAQSWGITVGCMLVAAVFAVLARRTHGAVAAIRSAPAT